MASANVKNPEYVLTLENIETGQQIGIQTSNKTSVRRLPRGAGVERKAIVQQDWSGGRGIEQASDDATRYGDGYAVFSHVSGQVTSGPLPVITKHRSGSIVNTFIPGTGGFYWTPNPQNNNGVIDDDIDYSLPNGQLAVSFVPTSSFTARNLVLLVRNYQRGGSSIDVSICANSTPTPGKPGTVLWTDTLISLYDTDDMAARGVYYRPNLALVSGTTYWLVVRRDDQCNQGVGIHDVFPTNTLTRELPVLMPATETDPEYWTDPPWENSNFAPLFYLSEVDLDYKDVHFFEYKRTLYMIPQLASGTASDLFINGDCGICTTGGGTQSVSVFTDSTKSWVTNEWAGCVLYITAGQNKGESRPIASNTGTALTLSENLPAACITANSEYTILGSNKWTAITAGLAKSCKSVAILNDIVYFATGAGTAIRRFRAYVSSGVWTREFADDLAEGADLLLAGNHWSTAAGAMYRALNTTGQISVSPKKDWGSALVFEAGIDCGNKESIINGMCKYNQSAGYYLYVGKEDGIFALRDGKFAEIEIGLEWSRDERNGQAISGWMTNLYFSFLDGFERLYGQVVDDIGPNRDAGLPSERGGRVADIKTVMNQMFAAYDAGTKYYPTESGVTALRYSSIFSTTSPGGDWHELFRGWEAGKPITSLWYQPVPGKTNRLWFRYGSEICYLVMPDTINPLNDLNMRYAPESSITTGWYDFGTPELDHYIDQLRVTIYNASYMRRTCRVYYQIQPEAKFNNVQLWHHIEDFGISPTEQYIISPIGTALTGSKVRFRISWSSDTLSTLVLKSYELRGDTMNEVLYDYQIDFELEDSEMLMTGQDSRTRAYDQYLILESWKEDATPLRLRIAMPGVGVLFDGILGHIDPVSLVTLEWNDRFAKVGANISFKQTGIYAT